MQQQQHQQVPGSHASGSREGGGSSLMHKVESSRAHTDPALPISSGSASYTMGQNFVWEEDEEEARGLSLFGAQHPILVATSDAIVGGEGISWAKDDTWGVVSPSLRPTQASNQQPPPPPQRDLLEPRQTLSTPEGRASAMTSFLFRQSPYPQGGVVDSSGGGSHRILSPFPQIGNASQQPPPIDMSQVRISSSGSSEPHANPTRSGEWHALGHPRGGEEEINGRLSAGVEWSYFDPRSASSSSLIAGAVTPQPQQLLDLAGMMMAMTMNLNPTPHHHRNVTDAPSSQPTPECWESAVTEEEDGDASLH